MTKFLSERFRSAFEWMEMPLTVREFEKVLIDQTDFRMEAQNLSEFRSNFAQLEGLVKFPNVRFVTQDVMVESFISNSDNIGSLVSGQVNHNALEKYPPPVRRRLAKIGVNAFFRMLIYDNFVHADCHGGNILI
jgi:aarF domain-containing kinase